MRGVKEIDYGLKQSFYLLFSRYEFRHFLHHHSDSVLSISTGSLKTTLRQATVTNRSFVSQKAEINERGVETSIYRSKKSVVLLTRKKAIFKKHQEQEDKKQQTNIHLKNSAKN